MSKWKCPNCGSSELVHLEDYVTVENPINEVNGKLVIDYEVKEFIGEDTEHRIWCDDCNTVFQFDLDYDTILSLYYNGVEVYSGSDEGE